jgi:hypothetical protein
MSNAPEYYFYTDKPDRSPFNSGNKSLRATLTYEIFVGVFFLEPSISFIYICVKNQQMQQLFIQFIKYA